MKSLRAVGLVFRFPKLGFLWLNLPILLAYSCKLMTDTSSHDSAKDAALRGPRKRSDVLRYFLRRDKTPVAILVVAAIVGTVAGLLGVAFEKA
ncbi:MAG: hypothetical protein L0G81_11565, partial [Ewingella sp.]|nr:hypothetical protein [Ewingella sp.]